MYKILTVFFAIIIFSQVSFADCSTGFACNINSLIEKEEIQQKMFLDLINKYFEKKCPEKNYLSNKFEIAQYKDIFIYNIIM